MRRLPLLLAISAFAFALVAQAADNDGALPPLNQRILAFCKKAVGKKVGKGQCTDLAYQALITCGAESPDDFKDDPKPGDYVWGDFIYGYKIEKGKKFEKGDRAQVRAGDVIQMRDVIIEHVEETADTITRETVDADHHTAVVESVSPDGMTYQVLEQNSNDVPTVTMGSLHLSDMKSGYVLVYRAVPDEDGEAGALSVKR